VSRIVRLAKGCGELARSANLTLENTDFKDNKIEELIDEYL